MIRRRLEKELKLLLREYPVVTIVGPRQAGKTTLAKSLHGFRYSNLEQPENREFARVDPKAFLAQFTGDNVVLDEIQRVPELLSYIQVDVDARPGNGRYVVTGSHQLSLRESISQSLAGRTGLLHLLPFSIAELSAANVAFDTWEEYVLTGFLPRVFDQNQRPAQAYSNYYQTYVERDVRLLVNLKDASLFERFMKLLAGRAGRLMDYSSLANDVGVDAKTIRNWLSVLEASYLIFKLPPYFENFGKRVTKAPKYYFTEVGLLAFLLGIEAASQLTRDPLMGSIFENLIVMECLKARFNLGKTANLYFYRDSNRNEVDLLAGDGAKLTAMEIKSSSTFRDSHFDEIRKIRKLSGRIGHGRLIYNGEEKRLSDDLHALRFDQVEQIFQRSG